MYPFFLGMMSESLFILPQRRKQKAPSELDRNDNKRVKRRHVDGVLIFDQQIEEKDKKEEEIETKKVQLISDIEFEYAESEEALEAKRTDAMVAAFLGVQIYLEPVNVRHMTMYVLAQYVNYKLPESEWFNDHITALMTNPVRLNFTSSQGIAYVHSNLSKYTLLMHMMGSPLHKVPSEYFVHKDATELLSCLVHFLEVRNGAFLVKNTFGLRGELELAAFQYNKILSFMYEPSFLIIDSYLIWVNYLLSIPQYRILENFLPQIQNVIKPIAPEKLPWQRLFSLNKGNTNYAEKRQVFEEDMSNLYKALNHEDIDTVKNELTFLWSKKASYVTDQIHIRLDAIANQLYPQ